MSAEGWCPNKGQNDTIRCHKLAQQSQVLLLLAGSLDGMYYVYFLFHPRILKLSLFMISFLFSLFLQHFLVVQCRHFDGCPTFGESENGAS